MNLAELVVRSAQRFPTAIAVRGPGEELTYQQLDAQANQVGRALLELGVRPGDRVGLWLEKSARAVVAMQGVLRAGAAYVPLDPLSPLARARKIIENCGIAVVVTNARFARELDAAGLGVKVLSVDGPAPAGLSWADLARFDAAALLTPRGEDELAYILYTSGSTGTPKGVCLSHRNAIAFVEWSATELRVTEHDRLSNHAPFFFDLSVLDLYAAFWAGARVVLVPDTMAFVPPQLVEFMAREEISVWYSVPSALMLMMSHGRLLEAELPALRVVLFAGEPFPIKHLRTLRERFSKARFLNLYGPTETNVCTAHEVFEIDPARTAPVPIGKAVCGDRCWIEKATPDAADGELWVDGPTVMLGYFGHPPQKGPYPTGDIVRTDEAGDYLYLGRRDNMLKVRGRRVEPGEIEAALLRHPAIKEVAVVGAGADVSSRLVAFAQAAEGHSLPALLELKRLCSEALPRYMIIDEVRAMDALPRTANGKVDRRRLAAIASDTAPGRTG